MAILYEEILYIDFTSSPSTPGCTRGFDALVWTVNCPTRWSLLLILGFLYIVHGAMPWCEQSWWRSHWLHVHSLHWNLKESSNATSEHEDCNIWMFSFSISVVSFVWMNQYIKLRVLMHFMHWLLVICRYIILSASTNIHKYPQISTNIHKYPPISANIHQYSQISTNIHQYSPINNIPQYSPIFTNIHQY